MEGWIKLYRTSLDHWLYTESRPLTRREAWETIIMMVNYDSSKTLIKGQLYDCLAGQSLYSLTTWAMKFSWSIQQVRTFFKLLEADGMIKIEGLQYTTRLTVCKWDTYQGTSTDGQQTANTPLTDGQQTANTPLTTREEVKEYKEVKEDKEINNIKTPVKFNFKKSLVDLGVSELVASDWLKVRAKKKASNTETAFKKIKSEIEKSIFPPDESIRVAVERNWSGFESDWILNCKVSGIKTKPKLAS